MVKYTARANGHEAVPDDMPPTVRMLVFLIEHANRRRDDGLPLPCPCRECDRHRGAVRCTSSPDGRTLIVESV